MEQKFSNNSLDLETLREFCKQEVSLWLTFPTSSHSAESCTLWSGWPLG